MATHTYYEVELPTFPEGGYPAVFVEPTSVTGSPTTELNLATETASPSCVADLANLQTEYLIFSENYIPFIVRNDKSKVGAMTDADFAGLDDPSTYQYPKFKLFGPWPGLSG